MKNEDEELRDFFLEMKEGDASREVPPLAKLLPQQKQRKLPAWAVAAAAINIILFVGGFWYLSNQNQRTIDSAPNPLSEQNIDFMKWETPTDHLLSDF
ncbi:MULTISPECIES: hypothetical protein [unclassified Imperialibacter]|uniref:hypothetical protein n=1 Tax=unclassified Imperialibacter TaxID=2629706 RepID=UPI00125BDCF4|nr:MULTISPECIES: hypothetical protein [unclassified Imperialibacter]CAD5259775.1 hypothetical protein IMPERIA75_240051 [Imperialibacter sp. 75]CAD5297875.1 hypothetical protein IMPERIA89_720051 [Imperialibacter sp. 89]VVT02085.1 hypothetical protein IMPR6_120019 [Imperialibacter sp. EC-SDR9]